MLVLLLLLLLLDECAGVRCMCEEGCWLVAIEAGIACGWSEFGGGRSWREQKKNDRLTDKK